MADVNSTLSSGFDFLNETGSSVFNQVLSRVPFIGDNTTLQALFILVVFIIFAKVFLFISRKFIKRMTKKTKTDFDDRLIEMTEKPVAAVLVLIGVRLAITPLNITGMYKVAVNHFVNTLIIIAVFYALKIIVNAVIDVWGRSFAKKTKTRVDDELIPLIHRTIAVIVFLLALLFILKEWGVNIGPLLASLGIAGLAIGLALQPTLSNIFAGIALILDKNFKRGDVVNVDGVFGTIEDIGLRTTRIKTFDNDIVTIPNNNIATTKIINHLQPDTRARFVIKVGVGYGSDIEKVKKILIGEVRKNSRILKEPAPSVLFSEFGDFSLNFEVKCWVADFTERLDVKDRLLTSIYRALNKNRIEIPFPTRTVYTKKG